MTMNNPKPLVLASQSPRRLEMLKKTGIPFTVDVCQKPEVIEKTDDISVAIGKLAAFKAQEVYTRHPDSLVIGADTIVTIDGQILGKPHSVEQATAMLQALSGRTHTVITGVALTDETGTEVFIDQVPVTFYPIPPSAIEAYVQTKEPYDKAGGYAIQGWAGLYIFKIDGNYDTVMGLPLATLYQKLRQRGY